MCGVWFATFPELSATPLFDIQLSPLLEKETSSAGGDGGQTGKARSRNCKPNLKHISRAYFDKQHT